FAQHALGGRRFLDFANDAGLALGDLVFNGLGKTAHVLARLRLAQQLCFAAHLARGCDFLSLDGENPRENVVHFRNFRVYVQNSSSLARAAPLAIVSKANFRASAMVWALLPA